MQYQPKLPPRFPPGEVCRASKADPDDHCLHPLAPVTVSLPSNARAACSEVGEINPVAVSGGIRPGSAHLDLSDKDPSENQNSSRQEKTQKRQSDSSVGTGWAFRKGRGLSQEETDIPLL